MRVWRLWVGVVVLLGLVAGPALALRDYEVWRCPWGIGSGMTINATDGSVWACMGDAVFHYDANHTLLSKTELAWPQSPCVDQNDGSCWVADYGATDGTGGPLVSLVHLASDGSVIQPFTGYVEPELPPCTGPDHSVWVNDGSLKRLSAGGRCWPGARWMII